MPTKPASPNVKFRDLRPAIKPKSRAQILWEQRQQAAGEPRPRRVDYSAQTADDREAAAALVDAGGICERCDEPSAALTAVRQRGGQFLVECLDRRGCSQRIYRQVAA